MKKVCLAASSGGHFEQLTMLKIINQKYDCFVITEKVTYSHPFSNQSYFVNQINRQEKFFLLRLIVIFFQTLKVFLKEKPDVVISFGALSTIPICVIAKFFRKKVIFIESFAKINSPTLTGRLVYKFADLFIIQWESLREFYPNAIYGGGIY